MKTAPYWKSTRDRLTREEATKQGEDATDFENAPHHIKKAVKDRLQNEIAIKASPTYGLNALADPTNKGLETYTAQTKELDAAINQINPGDLIGSSKSFLIGFPTKSSGKINNLRSG